MYPFEPLTALAQLLRVPLAILWMSLRAAASAPRQFPLAPQVQLRLFHGTARLISLLGKLDRLATSWLNGTLPTPRRRPATPKPEATPDPQPNQPPARPRWRAPMSHGWLARLHQPAGQAGEQLAHLLATEPQYRALAEAAPQAGRILRPLCRMLGTEPPTWLALPRRPRKPRPPRPRPERPWQLTDPRLGLRPYEIAAARAWKRRDR